MTFVHCAAYMTACVGPQGENIMKLQEKTRALLFYRLPMIVVADWNMEPQELATTGLLNLLGVDTVTPRGVQATCYSGKVLDYALVSRALTPAVRVVVDPATPWRAHRSLVVEVSRFPMSFQVRSLVVPRRFDLSVAPGAQRIRTPRGASLSRFLGKGLDTAKQIFFVLGDSIAESMLVGSRYSAWSEASEHWLLGAYGHSHAGPLARAHEGRRQFLAFKWTPLAHWSDSGLAGAVTKRARMWAAVESRLIDYHGPPKTGSQPATIQSYL